MRRKTLPALITAALTLVAAGAFAQSAATAPAGMQSHSMMQPATNQGTMMAQGQSGMMGQGQNDVTSCGKMATMHQAMTKKLDAMDAKLDGLVKTMNEAKGSAKVDAMAAVVNELVSQRAVMRNDLMSMQPMMMGRMMGQMMGRMMGNMMGRMMGNTMSPMNEGMNGGMAGGMNGCPLAGKTADKGVSLHARHH